MRLPDVSPYQPLNVLTIPHPVSWTQPQMFSTGGYNRSKIDGLPRFAGPPAFTTPEKPAAATIRAVKPNGPVPVVTGSPLCYHLV